MSLNLDPPPSIIQIFNGQWIKWLTGIWQNFKDLASTDSGKGTDLIAYPLTEAEISAGVSIVNPQYKPYDVRRYGVTNDGIDTTAALLSVAALLPYLWFPIGTYRITSTIYRISASRWVGEAPQMLQNGSGSVTPEVVIYGTVADIGDGNPMVQLLPAATQGSSLHTSWIGFKSDKSVNTASLSSMDSAGVNGVEIKGVKNGVEFVNCSFDHMAQAIYQNPSDAYYVDKLTLDRCHIQQVYRAVNTHTQIGVDMVNTNLFDCFDFVDSTTPVTALTCALNNSSFASETTSITAPWITWIGGWTEGGNNVFRPSQNLYIEGLRASETASASGATKALIGPTSNDVSITVRNTRVPTNTRLFSLSGLTLSTISVELYGLYDGTNFAETASIVGYLATLDYRGRGNKNSSDWNVGEDGILYTPTLTGVSNIDGVTAFTSQCIRLGHYATVSGKINVDPTAGATLTQVGISLPFASNLTNEQDCAGTASASAISECGAITADTTNDRAQLNFISAGTTDHTIMYTFTYRIQ